MTLSSSLAKVLPLDVVWTIRRHGAATTLQRRWRSYVLYSHARREGWEETRESLRRVGAWPVGWEYELVRREWRTEHSSWRFLMEKEDVLCIQREAEEGLWGRRVDTSLRRDDVG